MCRYAEYGPYKVHFACFDCRKSFKQTSILELPEHARPAPGEDRICKCPQCGKPMTGLGHDFKAPKQKEKGQWEKVRILVANGFDFRSCGCSGPGYRPAELKEVYAFVEGARTKSEGEVLLAKIRQKESN